MISDCDSLLLYAVVYCFAFEQSISVAESGLTVKAALDCSFGFGFTSVVVSRARLK